MTTSRTRYRLVSRRRPARLQVQSLEDRATPAVTFPAGQSLPVPDLQPSLALHYIIAMQGVYPSREGGALDGGRTDPFLGEIRMFAGNFAPSGWAFASGQILSISQNTALFSLLGTNYGGDGKVTFRLPDLNGRVPIGVGQGPGLTDYFLGQEDGAETASLTVAQLPAHDHDLPGGLTTSAAGANQPFDNRQPSVGLTYAITNVGIFQYIGEIDIFPYNFVPQGGYAADGRTLAISEDELLFNQIGTTYGGDGQNNFNVPDLRGRLAVGAGQGPGLSNYSLGQTGGTEAVTLTENQLPAHSHFLPGTAGGSTGPDGGSQPFDDRQPSLAVNYMIAVQGIFPGGGGQTESPFLGEVRPIAGTLVPQGWALAQGQLLSIAQNQALFSLLGTTYGGDGRVNFALPDLRGRVPLGAGQGLGLSNYVEGERAGVESHTLTVPEMAAHVHALPGSPPTLTLSGGSVTYTENTPPVVVDAGAAPAVGSLRTWIGGTLTVQITGNATAADRLQLLPVGAVTLSGSAVLVGGTTVGTAGATTVTGGTALTVVFNDQATDAAVQAVVRAVAFDNTSEAPSNADRTVTVTVADNYADPATATRTVQVSEVNDPATAADDTLPDVAEDSGTRTIPFAALTGNDSAGPGGEGGQTLTITNVTNAVGGAVGISGGNVLFVPDDDYNGPASFDYTVTDNGTTGGVSAPSSATAHVSFTITEVNDAPTATDDPLASVAEDSGLRAVPIASLLANDSPGPANEGGQTLTLTAVSNPVGGTVVVNGANVEFTPAADFNGTASFDYTVRDNGTTNGSPDPRTATGHVTFTVTEVNDAPTAGDDPLPSVAEDSGQRTIPFATLLGNDSKGPANEGTQTLTVTGFSNVVGGTLTISGTDFLFTPTADYNGPASFDYTIRDDGTTNGASAPLAATGHVSFTITEVNDAPTATDDALASIAEDSGTRTIPFATLLGNDSKGPANEGTQTLTITGVANAVGGSVSIVGTDVLFTPDPDSNGAASFDYTVRDDGTTSGSPDPQTDVGHVTFTVTEVNDAPTAGADPLSSIAEDSGTRTIPVITLLGNDSTGPANEAAQTLTVTGFSNVIGGTVQLSGPNVLFTPTANFFGAAGFDYTVADNGTTNGAIAPLTATATVSFAVTPVADTPSVTDAATTVNTQTTSGLAVTANPVDLGSVVGFQVTGITNGSLFLSNGTTPVTNGDFISVADGLAGLRFTPATDTANPGTTYGFDVQATTDGAATGLGGGLAHATITVTDSVPPNTGLSVYPPDYDNHGSTTFQFVGFDNIVPAVLTFEYQLDGGAWTPATSPVTVSGLADGNHTFLVRATDAAGNVDPTPAGRTWVVDTTAPAVAITAGPSQAFANGSATVTYTVTYTDLHLGTVTLSPADVTLNTTGGASATVGVSPTADPAVWTVTLSNPTGNGTVGITVAAGTATDLAGNPATGAGPSATFTVDTVKPVVTITGPLLGVISTKGGPVSWTVTMADAHLATPTSLTAAQVTVLGSGTVIGDVTVTKTDATHFKVTVSNIRGGQGTLGIRVAGGVAADLAGNLSDAPADSATVNVTGARKLRVGIVAPPLYYTPGAAFTYLVTYRNAGTQAADGVVLTVTLPAGATFNAAASTPGWTPIGNGRYQLAVGSLGVGKAGRAKFAIHFANPGVSAEVFTAAISDQLSGDQTLAAAQVTSQLYRSRLG